MENYVRRKDRKLIVAADDFGLTRGVNEAIVRAYRDGIVTTASLMANGAAFESAVILAKANPGLDIGLHLNLANDPFMYATQSILGKWRDADLEREIRSQIEKIANTGIRLTHIDGHKHVHIVPQVLRMICRVVPDYGIRAVRAVVESVPALGQLVRRNGLAGRHIVEQYLFAKVASVVWKLSESVVWKSALIVPHRFYGIAQTGFLDFAALRDIVDDLGSGVNELMCHPGYVDDELNRTPTRLLIQRERELELFTGPEVRRLIAGCGVDLISYKDLVEDYGSCDTGAVLRRYSAL